MSKKSDNPNSIRYLMAIEAYLGGRKILAKKLNVSIAGINKWVASRSVSGNFALELSRATPLKISCEQLLGSEDEGRIATKRPGRIPKNVN